MPGPVDHADPDPVCQGGSWHTVLPLQHGESGRDDHGIWRRCWTSPNQSISLNTRWGCIARSTKPDAASDPSAIVHYAAWMSPPATLLMWFQLRSPELAEDLSG